MAQVTLMHIYLTNCHRVWAPLFRTGGRTDN